jgi:hypothetical protein
VFLTYGTFFESDHEGFYLELSFGFLQQAVGVVAVGFQTAPLEAFVVAGKVYRKFSLVGVSQWPERRPVYSPQPYLVQTATLARDDLPGRRRQSVEVRLSDPLEQYQ